MIHITKLRRMTGSTLWAGCRRPTYTFVAVVALVLLTPFAALADHRGLSPDLAALPSNNGQKVDVIIQFRTKPTKAHFQAAQSHGASFKHGLEVVKGGLFSVPVARLRELASDPNVLYVSLDRKVAMHATSSSATLAYPAQAVDADVAWTFGWNGSGVGVAVVDSGVTDHPDLHDSTGVVSRLVYSESFLGMGTTAADQYGHGTHVAGIIGGNAASTGGMSQYSGIAPKTNIVNFKVLDQNGSGTDSGVIAAIQRAIQLKSVYNIRVLNLSLGRGVFESYTLDPLCQAVESAWKAGIVVVVAAGNDGRDNALNSFGYGTINAPGNDPYVITVGATKTNEASVRINDTIASYSSKGPTLIDHIVKPDLVAPGNRVVSLIDPGSTLDTNYKQLEVTAPCCTKTPEYFRLSGTSMSTPMVSGAAALMLQAHPELTPDLVKARLMKSAWKGFLTYSKGKDASGNLYQDQYDIFTYGAGYLDISAALNNSDVGTGSAMSPVAVFDPVTGTVTLVNPSGTSVMWGTSVLWGDSVVWGNSVFITGSSVLWGDSVVWGDTTAQGCSVLWGESVIWGSSTLQGLSDSEDGEDDPDATTTISSTL